MCPLLLQDALMDCVQQFDDSSLQDSDFLSGLAARHAALQQLQLELQGLSEELQYQGSLLGGPSQLMGLAASLFQALQQLSLLSSSYFFSLSRFVSVMREVFEARGRPLVSHPSGGVPGAAMAELPHRMVAQLLDQYRPCLRRSHVWVLRLLLSVALLQHQQLCSRAEAAALLRGLQDLGAPDLPPSCDLPGFIPAQLHPELLVLDRIPAFRGLISSLRSCPAQWEEYLRLPPCSLAGAVPCRSHSHLTLLQRALLWKTLRPHCLQELGDALAVCHLRAPGQGSEREAPQSWNPEALSRYVVKHQGAVVLTLPRDQWSSIQPAGLIRRMAQEVAHTHWALNIWPSPTHRATVLYLTALENHLTRVHVWQPFQVEMFPPPVSV